MAKKLKITANKNSNMYDIAKAFGTTVDELKKYNNLNSNIIKVGLELFWEIDDVLGVKDPILAELPYKRKVREYSDKVKMLRQAYEELSE